MSYCLQTHHLTKALGGRELVQDVSLHVKKGEIYGFLGPNGAGKTTVMKLLTNLWKPTAGSIELFGEALTPKSYELLKRIGSILEFPTFYPHLTGWENLSLHCDYMGYYEPNCIPRVLELLGLTEAAEKRVEQYSLGMKERLGIARAILCRPELLILDEPTNGLDPAGMKQIRDLLKMLCREYEMTILLSSHILSEVEGIADTIGILYQGRLLKEVSMQEIEERNLEYLELIVRQPERAAFVLSDRLSLRNFKVLEEGKVRIYESKISPEELSRALILNEVEVAEISRRAESLEDYFLKLTREEAGRSGSYVEAD